MLHFKEAFMLFFVMFMISLCLDSMNIMVNSIQDIYLSKAVIISSLYMASTMMGAHQIVHYLTYGYLKTSVFFTWIGISLLFFYVMRTQMFIKPKDWLREMIPHHSTAITTTTQLLNNNKFDTNSPVYKLATQILKTQKEEITLMKSLL
jgi:uncharacterized protein (DUF305 family)